MPKALIFSFLFHLSVFSAAWIGVPALFSPPPVGSANIQVELVSTIEQKDKKSVTKKKIQKDTEKTQARPVSKNFVTSDIETDASEPAPELSRKQIKKPIGSEALTPIPKKKPQPNMIKKTERKKLSALIPTPKRKPIRKSRLKQKSKKSNTASFKSLLKDVAAARKKADQEQFTDILRGLETEKRQMTETNKAQLDSRTNSFEQKPISSSHRQKKISQLIVTIRDQLSPCWNIPSGAKNLERLKIEVRIRLNPDGSLRPPAKISEPSFKISHPAYQVLAESALRALNDPGCMPLKLPPEEYQDWKDIAFKFDPRAALGR